MSARTRLRVALLVGFGLACSLLFGSLSAWQWGRGEQKSEWLRAADAALKAVPEPLLARLSSADPGYAVPVVGEVRLLPGPRLLLDNQQREGQVGVREYAVVAAADDTPALLVDLGWLPLAADRRLPQLPALPERFEARGLLTPVPGQGLRLGANPPIGGDAVLLTYLDLAELAAAVGRPLAPRLLRLDPELAVGHTRDLDVLPNTLPPEKHRGYALQWAGLSITALIITLVLSFRSRR